MRRIKDGIVTKNSIDEFMDEWAEVPHLQEIGKLAISALVLEAERNSLLFSALENQNDTSRVLRIMKSSWIGQIIGAASSGIRRRDIVKTLGEFSFIKFNYDGTIEQYVYCYCMNALGMPSEQAMEAVHALEIHHVYGSLGQIGPSSDVPYGAADIYVYMASRHVKTFTEQLASEEYRKIRGILDTTSKLVFLGFAFHDQNTNIIIGRGSHYEIWATVYKMRSRQVERLSQMLVNAGCKSELINDTCGKLIEEFQDDIFA